MFCVFVQRQNYPPGFLATLSQEMEVSDHVSYLNSLKVFFFFFGGFYRGLVKGLRGILGVQTMAHVSRL